ncbi:MAG: hypothetical protein QG613_1806, partial [Pseudomonadota bacterium]|nr:hypothetical protein [Pseudomonadota bacterium]
YPSYFKLLVRWLPLLTPVTYLCKLLGIHAVAAFMQLELFRVYTGSQTPRRLCYGLSTVQAALIRDRT